MRTRRLAVRRRLDDYARFAAVNGRINRADMARMGEVSIAQASSDAAMLVDDYPELGIVYDRSAKAFVCSSERGRERMAVSATGAIARSLSEMIVEWVDGGIRAGTNWRPGLEAILALRLRRLAEREVSRQQPGNRGNDDGSP